jgi:hypothetical protein
MSRVFEHFNTNTTCKLCGTNDDKQAVLIPIIETKNGGCCQVEQIHLDCLLAKLIIQDKYIVCELGVQDDN